MIHQKQSLSIPTDPYDRVHADLIVKFGAPESDFALRNMLRLLSRHFPDPSKILGLRFVDIGCGCESGSFEVDMNRGTWGPWLCRAVTILGGHAVGIDIGRVSHFDTFEFHQHDLTREDPLGGFEKHSFDRISCTNLFSSPELVYRLNQTREQRENLGKRLRTQCEELLMPSGTLMAFDLRLDDF